MKMGAERMFLPMVITNCGGESMKRERRVTLTLSLFSLRKRKKDSSIGEPERGIIRELLHETYGFPGKIFDPKEGDLNTLVFLIG
jgi:hypothetical protein